MNKTTHFFNMKPFPVNWVYPPLPLQRFTIFFSISLPSGVGGIIGQDPDVITS